MPARPIRSLTIDPPMRSWRALLENNFTSRRQSELISRPLAEWIDRSRSELRNNDHSDTRRDEIVIGTGHQADFWHPGILAKYLAAEEFARVFGPAGSATPASVLELVVDLDANDPLNIRVPIRYSTTEGDQPELRATQVRINTSTDSDASGPSADGSSGTTKTNGLAEAMKPVTAVRDPSPDLEPATIVPDSARAGLRRMADALVATGVEARNLAEQIVFACLNLRNRVFGPTDLRRSVVFATKLSELTLWRRIIEEMGRNPRNCAIAYNRAVRQFPDAGIALLEIADDRIELPIWRVDPVSKHRNRVFVDPEGDSRGLEWAMLWPRALLMTGVVRLVLVDLFIHGLGGKTYDRITEAWFSDWLGVELAPIAAVSADVFLDFGIEPATAHDVGEARTRFHHLKYNLDREIADYEPKWGILKRAILDRIEALPRRSAERYAAYLELQTVNEELRRGHADLLDEARERIRLRELAVAEKGVLESRDWVFPLHDGETLRLLREQIREECRRSAEAGSGMVEVASVVPLCGCAASG